jgi:hypothetical protein
MSSSSNASWIALNGRNLTSLLMLSGVATSTMTLNGGDLTGSKNMGIERFRTVLGCRRSANGLNFLLDGGDNNDAFSNVNMPIPFPDRYRNSACKPAGCPRNTDCTPAAWSTS